MNGQWVFIQAQDVWMFRDSKPFTAQQSFVARSQFPPNPQTMQGMIRTHYLESQAVDWRAYAAGDERDELYAAVGHAGIKGTPPTLGNLQITGPFVAIENGQDKIQRLLPAPLDLLFNAETGELSTLTPLAERAFFTNLPFDSWQPLTQTPGAKPVEGWLDEDQFSDYLNKRPVRGGLRKNKEVFEFEDRIGLGMDHRRRAAQEGLLYRARFIRPHNDIGLLMHVNQALLSDSGFIRVGGESRSARFRILKNYNLPKPPASGRIKIVLLTPAYFSDGWRPEGADSERWTSWVGRGQLVSSVIGKPITISGWDIANNRSKPLRHFVPAGSVYYFDSADYQSQPFTETPPGEPDFGSMGFGSIAVGIW